MDIRYIFIKTKDRLYETGGSRTQKNNIESVSNKFLIVGLGNIGAEYVNTRHGFKILDYFAKEQLSFQTIVKLRYKFKGRTFSFFKHIMNLRKAVQYWMDKENIPLENIGHY
jgi:PTH1 family peptidyl-tRNA hydrolase